MTQRADPDWHVGQILEDVKKAAASGEFCLKSYACDFGSGNCYSGKPNALQAAVMAKLKSLGYKVSIQAQERQFVDVWLEVSWKDAP